VALVVRVVQRQFLTSVLSSVCCPAVHIRRLGVVATTCGTGGQVRQNQALRGGVVAQWPGGGAWRGVAWRGVAWRGGEAARGGPQARNRRGVVARELKYYK